MLLLILKLVSDREKITAAQAQNALPYVVLVQGAQQSVVITCSNLRFTSVKVLDTIAYRIHHNWI